jgi:hypothetical protein
MILLLTIILNILVSNPVQSSSPVLDLLMRTLVKTFETPISRSGTKMPLSVDIMLDNDVFNLDDALRLFIQQYILALVDDRIDLLPADWEQKYPAYGRVINAVNNVLEIIEKRKLSDITMKDIRPLVTGKSIWLSFVLLLSVSLFFSSFYIQCISRCTSYDK